MPSPGTDVTLQGPAVSVRPARSVALWPMLIAAGVFVSVSGALLYRASIGGLELRDFRDAVYYPVVALLDGNNPYDTVAYLRSYPVQQEFPPYLPGLLAVHLPLGWLPFETAQIVYFVFTAALTLVLAYLTLLSCGLSATLARACGLGTLMILSRPGHWNLSLGQVAVPMAIGTYVALRFAEERQRLAALGLALALLKPTYGASVGVLLLARSEVRVVLLGVVIAGLLSAAPSVALVHAAGGPASWMASLRESYMSFAANPDAGAASSPDRVDVAALAARLLGHAPSGALTLAMGASVLGLGALGVARLRGLRDPNVRVLSDGLACLTVLTCIYHESYDVLLVALPVTALATDRWAPPRAATMLRWPLLTLLMVPAVNYVCTRSVLTSLHITGAWWVALTAVNCTALLVAFFFYLAVAFRRGGELGYFRKTR